MNYSRRYFLRSLTLGLKIVAYSLFDNASCRRLLLLLMLVLPVSLKPVALSKSRFHFSCRCKIFSLLTGTWFSGISNIANARSDVISSLFSSLFSLLFQFFHPGARSTPCMRGGVGGGGEGEVGKVFQCRNDLLLRLARSRGAGWSSVCPHATARRPICNAVATLLDEELLPLFRGVERLIASFRRHSRCRYSPRYCCSHHDRSLLRLRCPPFHPPSSPCRWQNTVATSNFQT